MTNAARSTTPPAIPRTPAARTAMAIGVAGPGSPSRRADGGATPPAGRGSVVDDAIGAQRGGSRGSGDRDRVVLAGDALVDEHVERVQAVGAGRDVDVRVGVEHDQRQLDLVLTAVGCEQHTLAVADLHDVPVAGDGRRCRQGEQDDPAERGSDETLHRDAPSIGENVGEPSRRALTPRAIQPAGNARIAIMSTGSTSASGTRPPVTPAMAGRTSRAPTPSRADAPRERLRALHVAMAKSTEPRSSVSTPKLMTTQPSKPPMVGASLSPATAMA